jgi:hypothetical protein
MSKSWIHASASEIVNYFYGDKAASSARHVVHVSRIIAKCHEGVTKPEPGYVWDWAAACGAYLRAEGVPLSAHRIAAVVATFAEPLVNPAEGCEAGARAQTRRRSPGRRLLPALHLPIVAGRPGGRLRAHAERRGSLHLRRGRLERQDRRRAKRLGALELPAA